MIVNLQNRHPVPVKDLEGFLARVQDALRISRREVTVALVSDAEITRLNRKFRGKKKSTDVLSFPAEGAARKPAKGRGRGRIAFVTSASRYLGDIAIATGVARRNARANRRSYRDELRVLVLHGVLHLLGYDHETDNGQMNRKEHRLRQELGLE
jgi:probable rRNA maturation factor